MTITGALLLTVSNDRAEAAATSLQVNPAHSGVVDDPALDALRHVWGVDFGDRRFQTPLIADGRIFVQTAPSPNQLYSLEAATGRVLWNRMILTGMNGGGIAFDESAGTLIVTDRRGTMTGLDPESGKIRWSENLEHRPTTSDPPVAEDGVVVQTYSGEGSNAIGRDSATGELLWSNYVVRGNGSAAIENGIATISHYCHTLALDLRSGEPLWQELAFNCAFGVMPVMSGGATYLRAPDPPGRIVDAETGEDIGSHGSIYPPVPVEHPGAPAGAILEIGEDAKLAAIDRESREDLWVAQISARMGLAPIVVGDKVAAATNHSLFWLNLSSGAQFQKIPIDSGDDHYLGGMNASDGVLAIAAGTRLEVFTYSKPPPPVFRSPRFDPYDPPPGPKTSETFQVGPGHEGYVDTDIEPPFELAFLVPGATSAAAFGSDKMFLATTGREVAGLAEVLALDPETGELVWDRQIDGVKDVVYSDGRLLVTRTQQHAVDEFDEGILALDASTGETIWTNTSLGRVTGAPTVMEGIVYLGGDEYAALDLESGEVIWSRTAPRAPDASTPAVDGDVVYFDGGCDDVKAFDRFSGESVWTTGPECDFPDHGGVVTGLESSLISSPGYQRSKLNGGFIRPLIFSRPPAVAGDRSVSLLWHDFIARDRDGRSIWSVEGGTGPGGPPLITGRYAWLPTGDGAVLVADMEDGSIVWQTPEIGAVRPNGPRAMGIAFGYRSVAVPGRLGTYVFREGDTPSVDPGIPPPKLPDTKITSGPPALGKSRSAEFRFTAGEPVIRFECAMDGRPFEPCGSSGSTRYWGLKNGSHTFGVRSVNGIGPDVTPASWKFRIDTTAPETSFAHAPSGKSRGRRAHIKLTSSEAGIFRCKLDDQAWKRCRPKFRVKVAPGRHRLLAKARDTAGNWDPTAARVRWRQRAGR